MYLRRLYKSYGHETYRVFEVIESFERNIEDLALFYSSILALSYSSFLW